MRCPACKAENADEAAACGTCGAPLTRRPRRRGVAEESDTPFSPRTEASNRAALRAYRLCVLGLVPGLGLALGPLAMVLGGLARARGRTDPDFTARGPALAAVLLGGLITLTNWLGLALMGWGLHS